MFNARDRELIQRIPIPCTQKNDSWFWLLEDSGLFTVRSVYRKLQGEYDMTFNRFWKKLWSLRVPGKVVNFLWRLCRGCLPTLVALTLKHVNVDHRCPWCHSASEDDAHVLFECGFAKTVWAMTGLQNYVLRG